MTSPDVQTRRRFLQLGTAASALIALSGCAGPSGDTEPEAEEGTGNGQDRNADDEHEATEENESNGTGDAVGAEEETDAEREAENETEGAENETDGGGNETSADGNETSADDWSDVDTITLGANENGWNGRSPGLIEGETNPTLELYAGREYELTWINNDGQQHEFVVVGETGPLEGTEADDEQSESYALSFEATADMVEYQCGIHTESMTGDIVIHEA